jgi:DNA segregation ATPase FtsK/SpoIIIE-like protein
MIDNKNKSILELVREVGYFIASTNYCSTSSIQRKFSIDFNRATQILEILEILEVVGSFDSTIRGRKILVSGIDELELKFD